MPTTAPDYVYRLNPEQWQMLHLLNVRDPRPVEDLYWSTDAADDLNDLQARGLIRGVLFGTDEPALINWRALDGRRWTLVHLTARGQTAADALVPLRHLLRTLGGYRWYPAPPRRFLARFNVDPDHLLHLERLGLVEAFTTHDPERPTPLEPAIDADQTPVRVRLTHRGRAHLNVPD